MRHLFPRYLSWTRLKPWGNRNVCQSQNTKCEIETPWVFATIRTEIFLYFQNREQAFLKISGTLQTPNYSGPYITPCVNPSWPHQFWSGAILQTASFEISNGSKSCSKGSIFSQLHVSYKRTLRRLEGAFGTPIVHPDSDPRTTQSTPVWSYP